MTRTHLIAKALYAEGKKEEAWKVAQTDEGLDPSATFEVWSEWMDAVIAKPVQLH